MEIHQRGLEFVSSRFTAKGWDSRERGVCGPGLPVRLEVMGVIPVTLSPVVTSPPPPPELLPTVSRGLCSFFISYCDF